MSDTCSTIRLKGLSEAPREKLLEVIAELLSRIARLEKKGAGQQTSIEKLRDELKNTREQLKKIQERLDEVERSAHRQAAPFRVEESKRKRECKPPGRKQGHRGSYRPRPESVDESIDVPLTHCPHCGGPVDDVRRVEQFIEEIPPVRARVTRVVTYQGRCASCGQVRSRHRLQASTATGAAGTHLGPNALSVALELNQRYGLTKRKTCGVLADLFGLHLSPGGLVSAMHRMASRLGKAYGELVEEARGASVVHADETSWWVGGPGWQLWVFTNDRLTLYRVRNSRGRKVVHETLGRAFPGVLVSDCLSSYDDASPLQHKCYAHHLKAISEAMSRHPEGGEGFLRQMKALLKAAQVFKRLMPELSQNQRQKMRQSFENEADRLLASRRVEPAEASVANRLQKQRDHLFTFLDYDDVDATNNLAERQLRPAVIARKVSCGNRTERGANTWEILASLAATCTQRRESFRQMIAHAARLPP